MQFGCAFPCIIQSIWQADPDKGSVRVPKLDMPDAYHRGTIRPSQVGDFTYVIPLLADDDCIIICINMVLSLG